MSSPPELQLENTDRELWREREGDFYANSIHVTKHGGIGINVGGFVYVMPLKAWHALAAAPPVQAPFDATAEPIWDQLTKIGESAPPGVWASVQAPADAPLYCPKCEKRLTFGDLTEPRPAQATDGGPNPYYEGLFDGEPEELRALRLRLVAERDAAQAQRAPEGWKLVPEAFLRGFRTLAHNYSLTAIPPDYYCGTEGDAFKDAFRRCGEDLAQLRAMLAASPTPPEAP